MGPFKEEEEGTSVASDVVKVQGEYPDTPGYLRGDRVRLGNTRQNQAKPHPSREVGSILANSRGGRKKDIWACTRRREPADGVIEHLEHTHIPPHTRTHAHTLNQRNTTACAYTMILCN